MRIRDNDFVVGLVGNVVPRKGHLHFFKAMEQIVASVPNFKLVLIGRFHRDQSYVQRLRSLQRNPALLNRVKWLGIRNNVQDFMGAFDLAVVPSIEEPLGLVALEAMAAGTPVVATNTGGLPEIVHPNVTGLLVPRKNPSELARAVIKLAQDAELRQRLGQNGRQFVQENFNPEDLARKVETVLFDQIQLRSAAA